MNSASLRFLKEDEMVKWCSRRNAATAVVLFLVFALTCPLPAQSRPARASSRSPAASAKAAGKPDNPLYCDSKSAVLMDALTGQVLYEQDSGMQMPPASFVKVLTLYVVFDAIRAGQLKMDDMITVSEKAWRIQGSKMFIRVGDRVKVEDLLKGIAIDSGNDSCIAIAEHLAGTEDVFVSKMNEKAAAIGMKDSKFMNAHGMPAQGQLTTAMDMAVLAKRYMEDHPEALTFHSTTEFTYNGIKQGNRNTLLYKNIGVDGLKTGHVEESGYHLLATGKRDSQRMIAVIMGCVKASTRAVEAQKLLEHGFRNFLTIEAVKKGATFGPVKVKRGKADAVSVAAQDDVRLTIAKGKEKSVTVTPQLPVSVTAPVQKGQGLGKLIIQNEGTLVKEVNLLSVSEVKKTLIPPWPVLGGGFGGFVVILLIGLWFVRRPRQRKF
jgi:serine-type D-Ala-D-Ala carboxypeptidase (penicillin-binding protein 5/6)